MKAYLFYTVLIMAFAYCLTCRAEAIESSSIVGASTESKYIKIGTNLEAAVGLGVFNAYIQRGQVNDDHPVCQPEIEVTKYNFYLNVWGNMGLTDNYSGRRDFTEVDLTLGYKLPVKNIPMRIGIIDYVYPSCVKSAIPTAETREVFWTFEYPNPILTPRFECYYDFVKANGVYFLGAFEHEFLFLNKTLHLTPGFSSGWGSNPFNAYYFNTGEAAFVDGNAYAQINYDVADNLTLSLSAVYMWLWNGDIRDGANGMYYDTKHWIFGLTATYKM